MKIGKIRIFFAGIIIIFLLSAFFKNLFLPVDILHLFPSFAKGVYIAPRNSLLADPIFQFEPWRFLTKESLRQGILPLWNPLNGNGAPFIANPQTAVFFPLNFIYYFLPIKFALWTIPLTKLFLFGFFLYIYLRSIRVNLEISLICAFSFPLTGFTILWLMWPQTNVFLFLPLFLYIVEKLRNKPSTSSLLCISSFMYFLAILGGHPETLFLLTIVVFFYGLFRLGFKKKLLHFLLSIVFGFFLGAFLILPFIEYLFNSYALNSRLSSSLGHSLPLKSFISNIIPFILGAPQLPFYKSFSSNTDFQEYTGGYAGVIPLLIALIGSYVFRKERLVTFWAIFCIATWMVVYGIFPFSFINSLPIIRIIANTRLIGFTEFGILILFALSLQRLFKKTKLQKKFSNPNNFKAASALLIFFLAAWLSTIVEITRQKTKLGLFAVFLLQHITFLTISSIIFYIILCLVVKQKKIHYGIWLLLYISLFMQTGIFFWNYNPSLPPDEYYPKTKLVKTLQSLPKGAYLEVGNPSIPAEINLLYGLQNVENNDALEISDYKTAFDKAFPIKNQWGKVDYVEKFNLMKFGVNYILSDYNINYSRQRLQPEYNSLGGPLINQEIKIPFVAKLNNLREIRILPADYNRINSCLIYISILDPKTKQMLLEKQVLCSGFLDKMFFTLEVNSQLNPGKQYEMLIKSLGASANSSISLWGNSKGIPYINLFYDTGNNAYDFISVENNTQIWKNPNFYEISPILNYKIVSSDPTQLSFTYHLDKNEVVEIQKTRYPGWRATVDGLDISILKSNPFISFLLPKGSHIVNLVYQPLSFIFGSIISLMSFYVLIIIYLRTEIKKRFNSTPLLGKNISNTPFVFKFLFFSLSLILSLLLCFIIIRYVVPSNLPIPKTTVVNWLTVHKHSLTLDYIRFILFSTLFPTFIVSGWIIFIWKRNQ